MHSHAPPHLTTAPRCKPHHTDVMSTAAPSPTPSSTEAWAFKNTMPAATTMILAATSQGARIASVHHAPYMLTAGLQSTGLASKAMEGFDGNRVRAALGVPSSFAVPVMVSLGYHMCHLPSCKPTPCRSHPHANTCTHRYAEASGTPAKASARFKMVDQVLHNAFDSSWEASP